MMDDDMTHDGGMGGDDAMPAAEPAAPAEGGDDAGMPGGGDGAPDQPAGV